MISIVGNGLTPSSIVAEAIRNFLIKLYKGNLLQYSELKLENRREERHAYFDLFKSFVQWEPRADAKIQDLFHKAYGKRISDIFGKIRKRGENRNGWVKRFMRIFLMGGKRKNSKRSLDKISLIEHQPKRGLSIPWDVELIMVLL
ncbi:hypothetical protein RYX36_031607 [Vicia faba]